VSDFDLEQTNRLYDVLRKQIEHEDDLIGQRVNWFVASQSFLFSAYAIILSNLSASAGGGIGSQKHLLVLMIPTLAGVMCILAWVTVLAGEIAIRCLRRSFEPFNAAAHAAKLPPVQGIRRTQVLGMSPPLLLPAVFFAVWMLMLFHGVACGLKP
jgi:hypothetical protein